ncbi:MAG: HEAT repeat domain-containing protein [Bryobacteraceae bacterium]
MERVSKFPDPNQLASVAPALILDAIAHGYLALDRRALRTLVERPDETVAAIAGFAKRDHSEDVVDLEPDLVSLIRHLRSPGGIPFLVDSIRVAPIEIPDDVIETLVLLGQPAVEPLLRLYAELDESEGGEVAFILASLRVHDDRILKVLLDRLPFDAGDSAFLLGLYHDPAALPALEKLLSELTEDDDKVRKEITEAIETLRIPAPPLTAETDEFDLWEMYSAEEELPVELLDEGDRVELLGHPEASVRATAAQSFFNREIEPEVREKLFELAKTDPDVKVRARAWEALADGSDETPDVVEAMLRIMRDPETPLEEQAGVLVGLSPEADRNEVRRAMEEMYRQPAFRAKALEAMWRSMHPTFKNHFAKHLKDEDLETRRNAIWGVGYHSIRSELEKLRGFFEDEDLRTDALFAYALTVPGDLSPARMKSLLNRIEKDATGLSEEEELLVMAALDERLALAGKKPYFAGQGKID